LFFRAEQSRPGEENPLRILNRLDLNIRRFCRYKVAHQLVSATFLSATKIGFRVDGAKPLGLLSS